MAYPSDLTDDEWDLVEPHFRHVGKRGRRHGDDLRMVVDAILYISKTGCQWRMLPAEFGPWTRIWTQFRRWSANGIWAWLLAEMHKRARVSAGRPETPSMVVVDSHMARGASSGGVTFHDRGGKFGTMKGAKRVVAVDVAGLPVAALVLPASVHDNQATEQVLAALHASGGATRLELVLVDRGVTPAAATRVGRAAGVEVRRVGWDDKQPMFRPSPTRGGSRSRTVALAVPGAWPSRSRTQRRRPPGGCMSPA